MQHIHNRKYEIEDGKARSTRYEVTVEHRAWEDDIKHRRRFALDSRMSKMGSGMALDG